MTSPEIPAIYDRIAPVYDLRYDTPSAHAEDDLIFDWLAPHATDTVLDLGCGTGLTLDNLNIPPTHYVGIDPSRAMLDRHAVKHPDYSVYLGTAEMFPTELLKASLVLALYGVGSYLPPDDYASLTGLGDKYAVMFYRQRYQPDYLPSGATLTDFDRLRDEFRYVTPFANYLIATNIEGAPHGWLDV